MLSLIEGKLNTLNDEGIKFKWYETGMGRKWINEKNKKLLQVVKSGYGR